jgi:hypothetical protein
MSTLEIAGQKFDLGRVVSTAGVHAEMESGELDPQAILRSLARHARGDWGDLGDDDKALNDRALADNDGRLFSAYEIGDKKIWIITEYDRSVTTVLFPEEY